MRVVKRSPLVQLLAAMFIASFLVHTVCAGGIRLVETKVVDNDGWPYVLRNISTQPPNMDVDEPRGVDVWIRHPPGGHGEHPFLVNDAGTIAVINIRPATKWEMVYLLLSFDDSNITIISDFNARIAALCKADKKEICKREIEIERIDQDVLYVWSRQYPGSLYDLKVKVFPSGELRLVDYKRTSM